MKMSKRMRGKMEISQVMEILIMTIEVPEEMEDKVTLDYN